MGRATLESLPNNLIANANTIVPKANDLLQAFGEYRKVNSGYRRPEDNAALPNSALHSKHMICAAIDLEDKDGKLKHFCLNNLLILEKLGLWMEDSKSTPTWVHVQCIPPNSGNRVFIP